MADTQDPAVQENFKGNQQRIQYVFATCSEFIEKLTKQRELTISSLAAYRDNQSEENRKNAATQLLCLAEMLTNMSTEMRVARGILLRP